MITGLNSGGSNGTIIDTISSHFETQDLGDSFGETLESTEKLNYDICKALGKAGTGKILLSSPVSVSKKDKLTKIDYVVEVSNKTPKDYEQGTGIFNLRVTFPEQDKVTLISLVLRHFKKGMGDDASHSYQLSIRGNPTSLLTGQNTFPLTGSFREETLKFTIFNIPFLVLFATCREIEPAFREGNAIRKSLYEGNIRIHNLQYAFYVDCKTDTSKRSTLRLLKAVYGATFYWLTKKDEPSVEAESNMDEVVKKKGDELEETCLGDFLKVKATSFDTSVLLRKYSSMKRVEGSMRGNNCRASLTFYDKHKQLEETYQSAILEEDLPTSTLRVDVTLHSLAISTMFKLVGMPFNTERTAANVLKALHLLESHPDYMARDSSEDFMHNYLTKEILEGEFCLFEALSSHKVTVKSLTSLYSDNEFKPKMKKGSKCKIRCAFESWVGTDPDEYKTLRQCLLEAGIDKGVTSSIIEQFQTVGISGLVPPVFSTEFSYISKLWGLTRKGRKQYLAISNRLDEGTHTDEDLINRRKLVRRSRENMRVRLKMADRYLSSQEYFLTGVRNMPRLTNDEDK